MTPEFLRDQLRRQPFQPFRVFLSDGSAHDVRHPEMALLTRREIFIAIPQANDRLPNRAVLCDLLHVTRIEPTDGSNVGQETQSHEP